MNTFEQLRRCFQDRNYVNMGHLSLVVRSGGEHLRLLCGDGGVSSDKTGENSAKSLNAQGQRSHIQQKNILDISAKHTTLQTSKIQ